MREFRVSTRTKLLAVVVAAVLVLGVLLVSVLPMMTDDSKDEDEASEASGDVDLSDIPDVVAVVNGEEIDREEFAAFYEPQVQQAAGSGQKVDEDEIKKQTVDIVVDNELLLQEADDQGLSASKKQVEEALQGYAEGSGMKSADEYLKALEKEQGLSPDQARAQIADSVAVEALVDKEVGDKPIEEAELRKLYDETVAAQGEGAEAPPFEDVRPQLEQQVKAQHQQEAFKKLAESARKDADIDVKL